MSVRGRRPRFPRLFPEAVSEWESWPAERREKWLRRWRVARGGDEAAESWLQRHDPEYVARRADWRWLENSPPLRATAQPLWLRPDGACGGGLWHGLGVESRARSDGHCEDHRRYLPCERRETGRYFGPSRPLRSANPNDARQLGEHGGQTYADALDVLMRDGGRFSHGRHNGTRLRKSCLARLYPNEASQDLLGHGDREGCGHVAAGVSGCAPGRRCSRVTAITIATLRERIEAQNRSPWTLDELISSLHPGRPSAERRARRAELVRVVAELDRRIRRQRVSVERGEWPSGSHKSRTDRGKMARQAHPNSVLRRRASADVELVERRRDEFECFGRPVSEGMARIDQAACVGRGIDRILREPSAPSQALLAAALDCSEETIVRLRRDGRKLTSEPRQEGEGHRAFRRPAMHEGGTMARLSPQQGRFQRPLYVSPGLDLETFRDEIVGEIRATRDELARLLIVARFGETPGDAAERILAEAA